MKYEGTRKSSRILRLTVIILALLLVAVSGLAALLLTRPALATAPVPGNKLGLSMTVTTLPPTNTGGTSTPIPSPTDTPTPPPTDTPTPIPSPTDTPTPVPTDTPTPPPTDTPTPTPFPTPTPRPTETPTPRPMHTPTPTATALPRPTATAPSRSHATPTASPSRSRRATATPPVHPTRVPHSSGVAPPRLQGTPLPSATSTTTQGGIQADDSGVSILVAVIVNIGAGLMLALLVAISQAVDKLTGQKKRKIGSGSNTLRPYV